MLEFGNLEIVEKTFTREGSGPRGQAYDGIKFRRYTTNKKGAEGSIIESFVISNELWNKLNLDTYALTQAKADGKVLLIVLEDQDEVKPHAKFMRRSYKGTNREPLGKGKTFNNDFLTDDLISIGVLDKETHENQYLALEDVTEVYGAGRPAHVKGIYSVVQDTTVDKEQDTEDTERSASPTSVDF
jgi:hypothetical protein